MSKSKAVGIVDFSADITIMGGSLFKKVANVARLWKRDFKSADKVPHSYDQHPFQLKGRMDLDMDWATTHFHPYFYNNSVAVYTDHSAMLTTLNTSSPSGKHAR